VDDILTLFLVVFEISDLIVLLAIILAYWNGIISGDIAIVGGLITGIILIAIPSVFVGAFLKR